MCTEISKKERKKSDILSAPPVSRVLASSSSTQHRIISHIQSGCHHKGFWCNMQLLVISLKYIKMLPFCACVRVPVCMCLCVGACLCACSCVQDGQCHGAARYNPSCGLPRGETAVPAPPRQGAALPGQDRQERVQVSGAGAHLLRDGRGEEESARARERDGETGAKQEVD